MNKLLLKPMHTYLIFSIWLLSLFLLPACKSIAPQNLVVQEKINLPVNLTTLDQYTTNEQWEQFFHERGASSVWQAINPGQKCINIHLIKLDNPAIPIYNQVNEVVKASIQYLIYHHPGIVDLQILGNRRNQYQKLTSLPSAIGQLTQLNSLDLRHNLLQELPSNVAGLTKLNTLDVSHNRLQTLPPSIGNLFCLTTLDLRHNLLQELPSSIGNLFCLTTLDLSCNQLEILPENIGDLVSLTSLVVGQNQLQALPISIENLIKLRSLDVSSNALTTLSPEISKLVALKHIWLNNNQLIKFPSTITSFFGKNTLCFYSNNQLCALPKSLQSLTSTKHGPNNPWYNPAQCTLVDPTILEHYCNEKLQPSLLMLCSKLLLNRSNPTYQENLTQMIATLPKELRPTALAAMIKESDQWLENQRLVYFEDVAGVLTPFSWPQSIPTRQDLKSMLAILQNKQNFYFTP